MLYIHSSVYKLHRTGTVWDAREGDTSALGPGQSTLGTYQEVGEGAFPTEICEEAQEAAQPRPPWWRRMFGA